MTATDRLLRALEAANCRPRQAGASWSAHCPAHKDRSPSLSLRQIEGQALLHCHAGCAPANVVTALKMTMADLYDEPSGTRYTYTDASGRRTRTVHRSPDKGFRQTDAQGQPLLYRLPRVLSAVAQGETIYLCEGEKDVLALESVGAVATTSPMGASNWSKVDSSPLFGAHVVVVPDNDQAGARYLRDVLASIVDKAASVRVKRAKVGKDPADHIAAGHSLEELVEEPPPTPGRRTVTLTPASTIALRPVRWLWQDRIALGTLALIGGREGIGKSTLGYSLAADITCGRLPGVHAGQPKSVLVAATEDSWAHTIVPRLLAAHADLHRVYRVDVTSAEGHDVGLVMPRDLDSLERHVREVDAGLILLDPLMSRLDGALDTHKDADVRLALEPLTGLADRSGAAVVGLLHVNKGSSADPLTLLMGSRAFAAVARAVLFVMLDPDDEETRLLGQAKNNLGRTDLPTLTFRIEGAHVADTDEGPVWTGRLTWNGERMQTLREALEASGDSSDTRTAVGEAAAWVEDYLASVGGTASSQDVRDAGHKVGHSTDALKRARVKLKVTSESSGFPRKTFWSLSTSTRSESNSPGETAPTALTHPTTPTVALVGAVGAVGAAGGDPTRAAPTADPGIQEQAEPAGEPVNDGSGHPPGPADLGPCRRECGRIVVLYGKHADPVCRSCRDPQVRAS